MQDTSLKTKTAGTLKWNVIDRVASQVLYAVTGIILARLLSQEDFGLVGAVLVFQAFASLLVDSGFSYALIQRKNPTETDYSTVLWFNMAMAVGIYIILYMCAPLIADCFQGDDRLVPLSRVMFVSFIINASAIVQTNRLMKQMRVKMVAVSNSLGLIAAAVVGIWLAFAGYGAWAIVWQTITLSAVKSAVLWATQRWLPRLEFSWASLRSFFNIGSRMMFTSFLNTVFLNIYSFFIGNRVGMTSLGYYSQSDKWSKMGIMSFSQVLTSSFLPALSAVQDEPERFRQVCSKINRFTSYLMFPAFVGLIILAEPIFHVLFGTKWDPSILLFQLLLIRGIFTILIGLYNNMLLALGHAKVIMWLEVLRDSVALVALLATLPYIAITTADDPVRGITILLWGQLGASVITWAVTLIYAGCRTGVGVKSLLLDMLPYMVSTLVIATIMMFSMSFISNEIVALVVECAVGLVLYIAINKLAGSQIQREVIGYVLKKE